MHNACFVCAQYPGLYQKAMNPEVCAWNVYDSDTRGLLGIGLYISGIASVVLCGLMLAAFLKTSLITDRSYVCLLNLGAACLARALIAGFLFSGVSAVVGRWIFGTFICSFYGFLKQFIGVYQMEAVTHMCIERYVVAKYIENGWEMTKSRYVIFISLCWTFSTLYSLPPLMGVGDYDLDFSCTSCNLNMVLPRESWRKWILVIILLLQSVKPVFFILFMLYWARQLESQCYSKKPHHLNHIILTQSTTKVASVALLCWSPMFLTTAWVIVPQALEGVLAQPPLFLAFMAALGSEIAPAAIALTILWTNMRVRQATISLFGETKHNKES